ncbi:MAG TPA: hypothetical protein PKL52_08415 [Tenuifilaceae bacterium]|nr:hypothetical protein [Tenuifilaceae bacterium]
MRTKLFRQLLATSLLLLGAFEGVGQRDIEPTLLFSDTVNYKFSGEWQYLSTDIYLLNGEKFNVLINELDFVRNNPEAPKRRSRRTGASEEYLEYLFITARLKNVRFFGDNDVTYPLYNFQISRDKDQKYRTYVSDNIDNIRIIDNLPLYSASDFIDAEINVRAITNNDRDQILGLVASQLQNLSRLTTPTNALLGIIGEFGNFIEANTKKKEYRFSSTIRLFEQKNFDTRLHSIRVYALLTGNSEPVELNTGPLSHFLVNSDNLQVNRQMLTELVNYSKYPLIIVANYKSLYRMEQVTGDEVNFANIEKRKLKIENDYRAGLINAETYRQERDFINFITIFANLKNHLEVYSLNYRTGNTDAISGSLFKLLQYYRQLLKAHEEIVFKYRGNSTFNNVFRKEYESIIGYASLYHDEDHNLKRLKDLAYTLVQLEKQPKIEKADDLEQVIASLRFADVFKPIHTDQSVEGQLIKMQTERLEQELYRRVYEREVEMLKQIPASVKTKAAPESLRSIIRNTACGLCREKAYEAIDDFANRMADFNLKLALASHDSIVAGLQPWFFDQLQKLQLAKGNLSKIYPQGQEVETGAYLSTKLAEIDRDIRNLQDFSRIDLTGKDLSMVETLNGKLLKTKHHVEETLELVCNLKPELCHKDDSAPEDVAASPPDLKQAFAAQDSLVMQANVFISIFEFQYGMVAQKAKGNPELKPKVVKAKELLFKLKAVVDVYSENLSQPNRLKGLEVEITNLIKEVSDILSELEGVLP